MAHTTSTPVAAADRHVIRRSMAAPLLDAAAEAALARRCRRGDEAALHQLVQAHGRLVIAQATRYRNYGLPLADLIQEGHVGLMQAAHRFEVERGVRFSAYAAWWVRAAMQGFVLRNWSIVRCATTAAQRSLFFNLRRLRARLGHPGRPLDAAGRATVAATLRVPEAEVRIMESRLDLPDRSLNAVPGDDSDDDWQSRLADPGPGPEEVVLVLHDGRTRGRWLAQALSELSPRERMIIDQRRLRDEQVTLEHLGRHLGLSKERVRQIEHEAMRKLRASLFHAAGLTAPATR